MFLLHCDGLPLIHVFTKCNGTTYSLNSFFETIAKLPDNVIPEWPVDKVKAIPNSDFYKLPKEI